MFTEEERQGGRWQAFCGGRQPDQIIRDVAQHNPDDEHSHKGRTGGGMPALLLDQIQDHLDALAGHHAHQRQQHQGENGAAGGGHLAQQRAGQHKDGHR